MPTLSPEQHVDTPKAKADACTGNLPHAQFEGAIQQFGFTLDVPARSALQTQAAGALDTNPVLIHQMANELFALRWPQSFFEYILQHHLVQSQVGHQLLEISVLFLDLAKPPKL